jgi:hypothetical protein
MKKPNSTSILFSALIPFNTCSTKACSQIETEQKILNTKSDLSARKSFVNNSVQVQTKNQEEESINPSTESMCYSK